MNVWAASGMFALSKMEACAASGMFLLTQTEACALSSMFPLIKMHGCAFSSMFHVQTYTPGVPQITPGSRYICRAARK